jgi:DNA processing protein
MARGIDTSAHLGALNRGGRTIAVLGSGIDFPYPTENKGLMEKISKSGAVISEFPMGAVPDRLNFPLRNRVISGLSLGVVVVEAAERSGALITADYALEQGREVFAVPGNVNARSTTGTHNLIKMGAKLVEKVEDIIEELEPQLGDLSGEDREKSERRLPPLKEEEAKVYGLLSEEPQHIDEIIRKSQIDVTKMPGILLTLEIKGFIKQLSGKMFVRK